jgi:hypothetical protein
MCLSLNVRNPGSACNNKIDEFIQNNNFTTVTDPTNSFQKNLREILKQRQTILQKEFTWKYVNTDPKPKSMYDLIKLYKQGEPTCCIINWKNVPAYKVPKHLTKIMNQILITS